eukprot:3223439-Rhodomonas_salina.3
MLMAPPVDAFSGDASSTPSKVPAALPSKTALKTSNSLRSMALMAQPLSSAVLLSMRTPSACTWLRSEKIPPPAPAEWQSMNEQLRIVTVLFTVDRHPPPAADSQREKCTSSSSSLLPSV